MLRFVVTLLIVWPLIGVSATRAEFISNAFDGDAENATRAAAARVFEGYQSFYSAMSFLERRAPNDARPGFQTALMRFRAAQAEYKRAVSFLSGKQFNFSSLSQQERQFLLQFLEPFGAKETSPQSEVVNAYAASFDRTIALIMGDARMTLDRFRAIQIFIGRQILAGTLISQGMRG